MWTAATIKRHIARLPDDQIFSTREFLTYGLRGAVDQALYRLVKQERIVRLARGIFIKNSKTLKLPSIKEIAVAKARAFGKRLSTHGFDALHMLGLSQQGAEFPHFIALGGSTSFKTMGLEVKLKGLAPRFVRLGDTPPGLAIKAMRQLAKSDRTIEALNQTMLGMFRSDRELIRSSAWMMPSWLSDLVYNERYRCAIGMVA